MNKDFKDIPESTGQPELTQKKNTQGHRPDYVFPLILIALGVIFLLSELGMSINWSIVWPIFLIIIGVGMIISKRASGAWVGLVIFILILTVIFTFVFAPVFSLRLGETITYTDGPGDQSMLEGARRINFNYGAPLGKIEIKPDTSLEKNSFKLTTTTNIEDLPPPSISRFGDTLSIDCNYSPQGFWFFIPWLPNWKEARLERNLHLNTSLPLNLRLNMTSGNAVVNTSGVPIEEARIRFTSGELFWDAGKTASTLTPGIIFEFTSGTANVNNLGSTNFGDLKINFTSGQGKFDLSGISTGFHPVSVGLTSGAVDLVIPKNVGYRVQVEKTSGSVSLGNRTLQDGERLESENFNTAQTKLDIFLKLTSGNVTIRLAD